jgi:hypothetical protein
MISHTTTEEIFRQLREDSENRSCFDCGDIDITHASVNLGILLCGNCGKRHFSYGINISHIKSLKEPWSSRHLKLMTAGGNSSLKAFFQIYSINESCSFEYKYKTVACEYYREMLKMMVDKNQIMMLTPTQEEGPLLMEEYREQKPIIKIKEAKKARFGSVERCEKALKSITDSSGYSKIRGLTTEALGFVSQGFKWGAEKSKIGLKWGTEKGKNLVNKVAGNDFFVSEARDVYNKIQNLDLLIWKEATLKMIGDLEASNNS